MYFPEHRGWVDQQLTNTVTSTRSRKKMRPHYKWLLAASALVLSSGVLSSEQFIPSARAESAAPGAAIRLDTIVVQGGTEETDQVATDHGAREKLEAMAGGTALITAQDKVGRADVSISDSIGTVPGVIVQNFFGAKDQPRVQIRGSGLQQNPVERGILMLQNGLPLNRADGSYIIGLADPGQAHAIEIFRGYTANRLGATVLGGAINFISPDGSSQPGATVNVEAGSFGLITTSLSAGGRQGKFDAFIQGSYTERDGYRDFNSSERTNVNLNVGAKINQNISTRVFLGYTDLSFDVTGPLPWDHLKANPKQAFAGPTVIPNTPPTPPSVFFPGPNVIRDLPKRETEQYRIGSRSSFDYGDHLFDLGSGFSYTDDSFTFPIGGGVRDTEGGDFSNVLRYSYNPDKSNPLPLFEATANYVIGSADRDNYLNINGNRGAQFGESELDASTLSLHAGMHIPLGNGFTIAPTVSYSYATRDNDDLFGAGLRPVFGFNPVSGAATNAFALGQDTSYDRSYSGWSPSLGLTYKLAAQSTLFGSVSRSFEPPTHGDLLATINGSPFFSPGAPVTTPGAPPTVTPKVAFATPDLDAQTATTIEAGWRGREGRFTWDVVSYYSWVDDELLNLRDASGVSLGAVNADKTTHFGIEFGASAQIIDGLSARVAYTYQDFKFDGDAKHGDNRLAGAPRHTINGALRYAFSTDFFVEAELNWRADDTPVDNANTLFNEDWVTVDLRSSYRFNEHFSIYGEIRNVLDETYASSTLITDVGRADQAAFIPGDGRAFIIGLKTEM